MLKNELDNVRDIQKEIKFLTNSDNRLKIIGCLFNSPQTLKDIHEKTGLNYSSISINISNLEERGYILNQNDVYYLTNTSKLILTNVFYLNKSINFLDKNADFLNSHKLDNLKFKTLKDLSLLVSMELVESTPFDISKTRRLIREWRDCSKSVKTIFPFMFSQINELFNTWFENDVEIKLILNREVSEVFIESFNNFKFDGESSSKIAVKTIGRDMDITLLRSEKGLILGFNNQDGRFDYNAIYVSREEDAGSWADEFFKEYEKSASEYIYLKE